MAAYIMGKIENQKDLESILFDVNKAIKEYTESLINSNDNDAYDRGYDAGYNDSYKNARGIS